jgi:Tfp pilus assembly protein PilF
MFAAKPNVMPERDASRLDSPTKKIGPEVYVAAAQLMENQNQIPQAQQQYERALKIAPNDLNALVGLARLYDRQGQSKLALQCYERALKTHAKSALLHNDLGLCYARQKQLDKSVQSLAKAVELQPENARYRNNLATVLVEAGRTDEALAQLSLSTSQAVAHYNVGFLLHKRGQTEQAASHLQQAIALDPGLTPARELLAQWQSPAEDSATAVAARVATAPSFTASNSFRTGTPAEPISIQMPTSDAGSYGNQSYRISDEPDLNAQASAGDGSASRLPPIEE